MRFTEKYSVRLRTVGKLFAVGIAIFGTLISSSHVSAQVMMSGGMRANVSCETACINNQGVVSPKDSVLLQEEKDTPAPPLDEPYYIRYQQISFPRPLAPPDLITSSSYKPPDISLLSSLFRF